MLLAGPALDLLFLGEELLERVVGDRRRAVGAGASSTAGSLGRLRLGLGVGLGTGSRATDPGSPSSGLRRPPPAMTMRLGRAWPEVSPTAMAASREIFSSAEVL